MTKKHENGVASGVEYSPRRKKQMAAKRRRQEARWAAKSGPVVIIKPKDTA